jgi:hypothetical protein
MTSISGHLEVSHPAGYKAALPVKIALGRHSLTAASRLWVPTAAIAVMTILGEVLIT